jgi:hypothetical protein
MAHIYSKATKVLLWIGKEEPAVVHIALKCLDNIMSLYLAERP